MMNITIKFSEDHSWQELPKLIAAHLTTSEFKQRKTDLRESKMLNIRMSSGIFKGINFSEFNEIFLWTIL